jgi:hypothetical protein
LYFSVHKSSHCERCHFQPIDSMSYEEKNGETSQFEPSYAVYMEGK